MQTDSIKLHEVQFIPVSTLRIRPDNPQEMDDEEFNNLALNISENGFLEPILVAKGWYNDQGELQDKDTINEVISGAHRTKAGVTLGLQGLPAIVIDEMPEEKRIELMVRANSIKGSFSQKKFTALVEKVIQGDQYSHLFQEWMIRPAEFARLYKEIRQGLPQEIREKLPETAEEIKTIDSLARILNKMFSEHGETLPYSFMIFDYGGKDSIWIQCNKKLWHKLQKVREHCVANKLDINDVLGQVLLDSKLNFAIIDEGEK